MSDVLYIAGLTYAAVEVCKQAGLPGRFAGLAAVLLGVAIAVLDGYQRALGAPAGAAGAADWVLLGVVAGLTAAGTYSGARAATAPLRRPQAPH